MKRIGSVVALSVMGLLALRVAAPFGTEVSAAPASSLLASQADTVLSFTHIRAGDPEAREFLSEAAARSYTVARLLDVIERSNVIVYLKLSLVFRPLPTSHTRLIAGSPNGYRYLSVTIDYRLQERNRVEMLGHELQHVVEIARATHVYSDDDLMRFYQDTGYMSWNDRAFETRGALLVQLLVSQELREADQPRTLFEAYCAACHGRDGRGSGPAAQSMKAPPTDLTRLSQSSGGEFPWSRVERCIMASDRRAPASVTEGMPVWSPIASHESDRGAAAHARDITSYVESIQRRRP